ncbi:pyridoxamine 5'-phosphate oxidase family protein [Streptomyces litchfieldiae]|uniref:Pyridoxamine 5'-phosphate oxidase family protein n=1 Tax=Streptomyces litchfieldiae TaxID=3075543 RepID=A0ABU2MKF1_9ACTN|nr:pyridoxamine 5'-phosphate oxidase family protein [Streptomyces sp. DSM 44938]MDT0341970.1 pyridoxamine 5'-phosphate oxidase family protein [Streptomyces sp. DSM 44938]
MVLTRDEREQFLAEPHIAALSVAAGGDRAPLTVPVWYRYTPGSDVRVLTGAHSRKARLIEAAGRFTIMVDRLEPTVRYVTVEGPVTDVTPATRDDLHTVAARYLPPEKVDGYVDFAWEDHGDQVIFHLRPEHWLSSDLGTV